MRSPEDDVQYATQGARARELFGGGDATTDRNREQLVPEQKPAEKQSKGFVDYLNTIRAKLAEAKASAPVQSAPPLVHWSMRVLRGNDVNDIDFEERASLANAAPESGQWQMNGSLSPTAPHKEGRNAGGRPSAPLAPLGPALDGKPSQSEPVRVEPMKAQQPSAGQTWRPVASGRIEA